MIGVAPTGRRGASAGDVLILLAILSIAAALLYPAWSVRGFRARVERAVTDAETLAEAASDFREESGRWPSATTPGDAPPELSALAGDDGVFGRSEYTVGWTTWEVVDSVPAPPPPDVSAAADAPRTDAAPFMEPVVRSVGAVMIRSADEDLLAELLLRYSDGASFVLDTTWLLVLPERGGAPAAP